MEMDRKSGHSAPSKVIYRLMAFGLVLALVACGSGATSDTKTTTSGDTGTTEMMSDTTTTSGGTDTTMAEEMTEITVGPDGKLPVLDDGFPDSPITLWAAFAVGSNDDILNRAVEQVANKYSPVRIAADAYEAGINMGYELVDHYLPDLPRAEEGYHIYDANWLGMAVRPYSTETAAQYDPYFMKVIGAMVFKPFMWVVPLDSPYNSLEELAAAPEAKTGELRYCSGTPTSTTTIAGLAWLAEAGLTMTFVPAEGNTGGRALMTGGGCEFGVFSYYPGILDEYKALASNYGERNADIPDVPTLDELGYATIGGNLQGYGVLDEVPESHVEWIVALLKLVVEDQEFIDLNPGAEVSWKSPEEVKAAMQGDIDAFYPILEQLGMAVREK
jgi:tripartite-type tricarboxylate transporter receptor subunit TctC